MEKIYFYTKEACQLCDEAYQLLRLIAADYPLPIEKIDIYEDEALLEKYHLTIPVIQIKDQELFGQALTYERIEAAIQAASP